MSATSVLKIFQDIEKYFNDEQQDKEQIKSAVQDLEQSLRHVLARCQGIHSNAKQENLDDICSEVEEMMKNVISVQLYNVALMLPSGQYYRFNDHWRFSMQRLVFVTLLLQYLRNGTLMNKEETDKKLLLDEKWENGFRLDLEDYLQGILLLTNELARFSVNCVIAGNYDRPFRIASFISEIDGAFRLLNLKNDSLRKRFDGLKYSLKKAEEVVYDLTVRGLKDDSKTSS